MKWLTEDMISRVDRSLFAGEYDSLLAELSEYIKSREPLASSKHLDDFLESVIWKDMLREYQVWISELEALILSGGSDQSEEYLRGALAAVHRARAMPEYLQKQIEDKESEAEETSSNDKS